MLTVLRLISIVVEFSQRYPNFTVMHTYSTCVHQGAGFKIEKPGVKNLVTLSTWEEHHLRYSADPHQLYISVAFVASIS